MLIFVDVDNSDPDHKIFKGSKAGALAKQAEAKMQEVTKKIIDDKKQHDFTTTKSKDAKGYVILITLAKVEADSKNAKCTLSGEIVQYPREVNAKGEIGDVSVAMRMTASGGVQYTSNPVIECVEALTEDLVTKAVPVMRMHFATKR